MKKDNIKRNVASMNNSNCSTAQQLNNSTSDGNAIRVKKMKMETRIRNEASMNTINLSSTHPLTNSYTHLLKNKIAVKTIKNIKWANE